MFQEAIRDSYRIELKNGKDEDVLVRVVEPMPGDWEILSENQTHKKISSSEAEWLISVPSKGLSELLYTVKVKF